MKRTPAQLKWEAVCEDETLTEEVFKFLEVYPKYYFSSLGRVRSHAGSVPRFIYGRANKEGYVHLNLGPVRKDKYLAHLICEAFHGPCPEGKECDHINRKRYDNRACNLRWVTRSEQMKNRAPYTWPEPMSPEGRANCAEGARRRWARVRAAAKLLEEGKDGSA